MNENLIDQVINKYDALMMLPENKNFFVQAYQLFVKNVLGSDVNKKDYLEETLRAMFFQLNNDNHDKLILETFDQAFNYISDIYRDIRYYFLNKRQYDVDHLIGCFFKVLLQISQSNSKWNLNLSVSTLIVANNALKSRYYYTKDWLFSLFDLFQKSESAESFEALK